MARSSISPNMPRKAKETRVPTIKLTDKNRLFVAIMARTSNPAAHIRMLINMGSGIFPAGSVIRVRNKNAALIYRVRASGQSANTKVVSSPKHPANIKGTG